MLGCGARGEDDDANMTPLQNSPDDSARRPLPSQALPSGALFNLLLPVLGLAATTMLLATVAVGDRTGSQMQLTYELAMSRAQTRWFVASFPRRCVHCAMSCSINLIAIKTKPKQSKPHANKLH